jgi:hypothetical protein
MPAVLSRSVVAMLSWEKETVENRPATVALDPGALALVVIKEVFRLILAVLVTSRTKDVPASTLKNSWVTFSVAVPPLNTMVPPPRVRVLVLGSLRLSLVV